MKPNFKNYMATDVRTLQFCLKLNFYDVTDNAFGAALGCESNLCPFDAITVTTKQVVLSKY